MPDGAVIPLEHTAVPVEWDEVKDQLMRLATDLGPNSKVSTPSVARFIDSAADALGGNGDKLRQTLAQLSGVGRILADGSGNIVDIIKNLQTFVSVFHDSSEQLVLFNNRLATLTSVLDDNKSDLDSALTNLAQAVGEVQRFIAGSRDQTSEQIARLADLTQILVDNKMALQNILHVAPNALADGYNGYEPDTGAHPRRVRPQQPDQSRSEHLREHRVRRERHCDRIGQAVRTVRRPGTTGVQPLLFVQLQLSPRTDQPIPGAVGRQAEHHLLRAAPGARR